MHLPQIAATARITDEMPDTGRADRQSGDGDAFQSVFSEGSVDPARAAEARTEAGDAARHRASANVNDGLPPPPPRADESSDSRLMATDWVRLDGFQTDQTGPSAVVTRNEDVTTAGAPDPAVEASAENAGELVSEAAPFPIEANGPMWPAEAVSGPGAGRIDAVTGVVRASDRVQHGLLAGSENARVETRAEFRRDGAVAVAKDGTRRQSIADAGAQADKREAANPGAVPPNMEAGFRAASAQDGGSRSVDVSERGVAQPARAMYAGATQGAAAAGVGSGHPGLEEAVKGSVTEVFRATGTRSSKNGVEAAGGGARSAEAAAAPPSTNTVSTTETASGEVDDGLVPGSTGLNPRADDGARRAAREYPLADAETAGGATAPGVAGRQAPSADLPQEPSPEPDALRPRASGAAVDEGLFRVDPDGSDPGWTEIRGAPQRLAAGPPPVFQAPDTPRNVAMQIAEVVRASGERAVELRLHPEELGRVQMTMSQDATGTLTVALNVERAETLDLLRRNIDLLGADLRELGYENVDFSFQGDGAKGQNSAPPSRDEGTGTQIAETGASGDVKGRAETVPPGGSGDGIDIRM